MPEREDERLDAQFRAAYRGGAGDGPELARTLARLRREPPERSAGPFARGFAPRAVTLYPAPALAAALAALALAALAGARFGTTRAPAPAPVARVAAAPGVRVEFVLRAPGATSVGVAGDFNGWDAASAPMVRAGTGETWTVTLTVPRGVHQYAFVLDGDDWQPDPSAPLAADASFGRRNSVLVAGAGRDL